MTRLVTWSSLTTGHFSRIYGVINAQNNRMMLALPHKMTERTLFCPPAQVRQSKYRYHHLERRCISMVTLLKLSTFVVDTEAKGAKGKYLSANRVQKRLVDFLSTG